MTTTSTGTGAGAPPPHPPGSTPPRELRRLPDQGHLGGVCAGLAQYFNVDVAIVRIAAVVLAFTGPGVPAYVLAWIFLPEARGGSAALEPESSDRGAQVVGLILIGVALSVLWGGWWEPMRRWLFPLALIALGGWLILRRSDRPRGTAGVAPESASAPSEPWAGPLGVDAPHPPTDAAGLTDAGDPTDSAPEDGPATGPTDVVEPTETAPLPWGPFAGGSSVHAGGPPPPWSGGHGSGGPPPPTAPDDEPEARRRRIVLPTVLGALLVWAGVAFLTGVAIQTALAIALCIVGLGFVLGAFVGGSGALVVPAVLLAGALVLSTVLDLPLRGPIGERTWVPQSVDELTGPFELTMGAGVLDLTEVDLTGVDEVEVTASVGIGNLDVLVPQGVALEVKGESGVGDVTILGRSSSGWGVASERTVGGDEETTVVLDLEVGLGQVEVIVAIGDDPGTASRREPATTASSTLG